jgi:hypothetical protein
MKIIFLNYMSVVGFYRQLGFTNYMSNNTILSLSI